MLRTLAAVVAVATAVHTSYDPAPGEATNSVRTADAVADIRALLAESAGASPLICAMAARTIGNGGWFQGRPTPIHPLPAANDPVPWNSRSGLAEADAQFVLAQLADGNGCVREIAVRLLALDQSERTIDGPEAHLRSHDANLAAAAAFGLGLIAEERSLEPLMTAASNPSTATRVNVIWALGRIGDTRGFRAVVRGTDDNQGLVRVAAAEALGRIDTSAAVAALIRRLRQDDSPDVRRVAAWALAQHEAEEALDDLAQALDGDADPEVREMSAWAIGSIDRPGADAALVGAARRDGDPSVRESAVWALGVRDDRASVAAVEEVLAGESDARVRATAAWALGVMRPSAASRGLIAALGDADPDVRIKAAWAISEIRDSSTTAAVSAALRRESRSDIRRALMRALIRSGAAESHLISLLDSPDAKDRQMVARALAGSDRIDPWPWPMPPVPSNGWSSTG
ncbi:MAG TPA: HEAT repeat domain-containing protein, partial [Gemmatimonadales bacterium]|nr:HEAT repeat domain-containing protein [Gemmatimonadales bacterium]